jgi:hypothetical protein
VAGAIASVAQFAEARLRVNVVERRGSTRSRVSTALEDWTVTALEK